MADSNNDFSWSKARTCCYDYGATHGDELNWAERMYQSSFIKFTGRWSSKPNNNGWNGRIVPVINLPGYRSKSRYFPDGRDLNRAFPGLSKGSTTSRVASMVKKILSMTLM